VIPANMERTEVLGHADVAVAALVEHHPVFHLVKLFVVKLENVAAHMGVVDVFQIFSCSSAGIGV